MVNFLSSFLSFLVQSLSTESLLHVITLKDTFEMVLPRRVIGQSHKGLLLSKLK